MISTEAERIGHIVHGGDAGHVSLVQETFPKKSHFLPIRGLHAESS
jgi:hypothetical protein